jgi:hypothetical protein
MDDLETQVAEFLVNFVSVAIFIELLEGISKMGHNTRTENLILNACKSVAVLSVFGSTCSCEQLFSTMKYIKSDLRKRLSYENSADYIVLKLPCTNRDLETCAQQATAVSYLYRQDTG